MKHIYRLLFICIILSSCGASKNKTKRKKRSTNSIEKALKTETKSISKAANSIIKEAQTYKGTKYKYGGNTKCGIDCSGLVHNSFKENGMNIPRTTRDLSKTGEWVDIKKVEPGDLVFFATKKNSRNINHVGIVTNVNGKDFTFIHSTTSRGVIESNITQRYWYLAYVQARRYL